MPPTRWNARRPADITAVAARVPLPLSITTYLRTRAPRTRDAASYTVRAAETVPPALTPGNQRTSETLRAKTTITGGERPSQPSRWTTPDPGRVACGGRPITLRRAWSNAAGARPRRRHPSWRTR
jgi:hypothetical protein